MGGITAEQDPIPVRLSGRRHGAAQDDRVALWCIASSCTWVNPSIYHDINPWYIYSNIKPSEVWSIAAISKPMWRIWAPPCRRFQKGLFSQRETLRLCARSKCGCACRRERWHSGSRHPGGTQLPDFQELDQDCIAGSQTERCPGGTFMIFYDYILAAEPHVRPRCHDTNYQFLSKVSRGSVINFFTQSEESRL